jgi:hypothetical protein
MKRKVNRKVADARFQIPVLAFQSSALAVCKTDSAACTKTAVNKKVSVTLKFSFEFLSFL